MQSERYGDEFEQYLTDVLRDEGSLDRRRLFEEFVRGAVFHCNRCRKKFEMRAAAGVEEDDEMLCPRCAKEREAWRNVRPF
ncbi:MAG: hypothetical protein ACRD1X_22285 [Vicinamibacteria bacterium]